MSGAGVLIGTTVGLSVGCVFGFSAAISGVDSNAAGHDMPPPPKIVEVPQVETRDVPGPTEYVVQPLPESCLRIESYSNAAYDSVTKLDVLMNNITGYIDSDLVPHTMDGNLTAVAQDNIKIQKWASQSESVIYRYLNSHEQYGFNVDQCAKDLDAAQEGGEYVPAN